MKIDRAPIKNIFSGRPRELGEIPFCFMNALLFVSFILCCNPTLEQDIWVCWELSNKVNYSGHCVLMTEYRMPQKLAKNETFITGCLFWLPVNWLAQTSDILCNNHSHLSTRKKVWAQCLNSAWQQAFARSKTYLTTDSNWFIPVPPRYTVLHVMTFCHVTGRTNRPRKQHRLLGLMQLTTQEM